MKAFKRVLSLCLILATLFSGQFATSVSAATTTKKYDCDKTVTLTVKTSNKAASMKLVCKAANEKKTIKLPLLGTTKTYSHTCSVAPKMIIKVTPKVDGKQYFYLQGTGRSISSTLRLDKNKTYTVQISYYYNSCNLCKCSANDLNLFHAGEAVGSPRYYSNGDWQVTSSKNLDITKITVR